MNITELTPALQAQWSTARAQIPVGRNYKHYKGGIYHVTGLAFDADTCEPVVEYRNLEHGTSWVRKASSWLEPAKKTEHQAKPGKKGYNYEPITEEIPRFKLLGLQ
jgi:hypothetical protein